jgi:hypothetical protein
MFKTWRRLPAKVCQQLIDEQHTPVNSNKTYSTFHWRNLVFWDAALVRMPMRCYRAEISGILASRSTQAGNKFLSGAPHKNAEIFYAQHFELVWMLLRRRLLPEIPKIWMGFLAFPWLLLQQRWLVSRSVKRLVTLSPCAPTNPR